VGSGTSGNLPPKVAGDHRFDGCAADAGLDLAHQPAGAHGANLAADAIAADGAGLDLFGAVKGRFDTFFVRDLEQLFNCRIGGYGCVLSHFFSFLLEWANEQTCKCAKENCQFAHLLIR
jgi:hypothetical protein